MSLILLFLFVSVDIYCLVARKEREIGIFLQVGVELCRVRRVSWFFFVFLRFLVGEGKSEVLWWRLARLFIFCFFLAWIFVELCEKIRLILFPK